MYVGGPMERNDRESLARISGFRGGNGGRREERERVRDAREKAARFPPDRGLHTAGHVVGGRVERPQ